MNRGPSKLGPTPSEQTPDIQFGAFLKILRLRHGIRQSHMLHHLPNWTQTNYSRVESGELAPAFDQLAPIYTALQHAGVALTPQDRQQFLTLARLRIEAKKTCREIKSDQEWDTLRVQLSRGDAPPRTAVPLARSTSGTHFLETRHLIGREDWLASVLASLQGTVTRKLVVVQGPTGIGKSSELHRIAHHFLAVEPRPLVILCDLPPVEQQSEPENALDLLLGTLLAEIGSPDDPVRMASLPTRVAFVLDSLEKLTRPVLILVDNAEQLIDVQGHIDAYWQNFLSQFLRRRHHASLVLATKEWPGWHEGERMFVAERSVPFLLVEDGIALLQRLGLSSVPVAYLQQVSDAVGGVPLCLEWVASLVKKSLWLDSWDDLDDLTVEDEGEEAEILTRRLLRLLDDPMLFGGPIASRLTPLLERIITHRLSAEALQVLHTLSLASIPLGKIALQNLCPRPGLLRELRTLSLLTTHAQRVQVLPMVASLVRFHLLPEQQQQIEERLIETYLSWLEDNVDSDREAGAIITELVSLYLKQRCLLDAAELIVVYGWMSFNQGYGPRLARLAQQVTHAVEWKETGNNEAGALLLYHLLAPFLGKVIETEKRAADFQHILTLSTEGKVTLQPTTEMDVLRLLMMYHIGYRRFEEAQAILEGSIKQLAPYHDRDVDVQVFLLARRASLLAKWGDHLEEQGKREKLAFMRKETIDLYRECCTLVSNAYEVAPLKNRLLKKRLSAYMNYLGYHLMRNGQATEALEVLQQSIALGEQGYCNFGALASAYGDMSQALMELGRFEEAWFFDEKAMAEIQRCAESGDAYSQDEVWVYKINRGRLFLRMGKIAEAETLLQEAEPHLKPYRSIYGFLARRALEEIKQWSCHELPHQEIVG